MASGCWFVVVCFAASLTIFVEAGRPGKGSLSCETAPRCGRRPADRGAEELRRSNADNGVHRRFQGHCLADNCGIAPEASLPPGVTHHRHWVPSGGFVFGLSKTMSQDRFHAQHGKVISRNEFNVHRFQVGASPHSAMHGKGCCRWKRRLRRPGSSAAFPYTSDTRRVASFGFGR